MTVARILSSNRLTSAVALGLVCTPFLGIAPTNILLVVAALLLLNQGVKRFRDSAQATARLWLVAVVLYLATRVAATITSLDVAVSLRHLAKDWRLVALFWGASGVYASVSRRGLAIGLTTVLACSIVVGVVGISSMGSDATSWRTGSLLGTPMTEGGVMMLALFAPGILQFNRRPTVTVVILATAMLLMTSTKSAILGAVVGGIVVVLGAAWPWRNKLAVAVLAAAVVAAVPGPRQRFVNVWHQGRSAATVHDRLNLWRQAVREGLSRPFGVGPGYFGRAAMRVMPGVGPLTHAHNIYFHAFAEGGFPGLLGILILIGGFALALMRGGGPTARYGMAATVAMVVEGMFEQNFYDGEVAILWFTLIGIALHRSGAGLTLTTDWDRRFSPEEELIRAGA